MLLTGLKTNRRTQQDLYQDEDLEINYPVLNWGVTFRGDEALILIWNRKQDTNLCHVWKAVSSLNLQILW